MVSITSSHSITSYPNYDNVHGTNVFVGKRRNFVFWCFVLFCVCLFFSLTLLPPLCEGVLSRKYHRTRDVPVQSAYIINLVLNARGTWDIYSFFFCLNFASSRGRQEKKKQKFPQSKNKNKNFHLFSISRTVLLKTKETICKRGPQCTG